MKWKIIGGDGTKRTRLDCMDLIPDTTGGVESTERATWGAIRALYR